MVFIAHWIIFYQYLELAVALPILIKIADHAHNASNKIASARQCLNATMIIVVAIVVAHFVDKAFYTFKESSEDADQKVTYFAIALKMCLIVMIAFVFIRIRTVVNSEPLIKLNMRQWTLHVGLLSIYYLMWAAYEIAYTVWILDPNSKRNFTDTKLKMLAIVELTFNVVSVFLGCLLFYMVDRMTRPVEECYFDPILKRHVPFFVHLANTKLISHQITTEQPDATACQHILTTGASMTFAPNPNSGSPLPSPPSEPASFDHFGEQQQDESSLENTHNMMATTKHSTHSAALVVSQMTLQHSRATRQSAHSVTRRGTQLTALDRELIRSEETYSQMRAEVKWNRKIVKLALQFISFETAGGGAHQINFGSVLIDS